jgi:uncharacterized membrane protein YgdD (TMEM256/DUF423 family)
MPRPELRAGLLALAGGIGATAVMAAAVSAHGPLASEMATTASYLQLFHALALAVVGLAPFPRWGQRAAALLFTLGIVGFCGGVYSLAWLGISLGPIVPLGGACLILGWLVFGVAGFKSRFSR